MADENFDEPDSPAEPDSTLSACHRDEAFLLNELLALVDPRPDPGIYRDADSDAVARDVVELYIMFSFDDPRPYTNPWVKYFQAEDLIDESSSSQG